MKGLARGAVLVLFALLASACSDGDGGVGPDDKQILTGTYDLVSYQGSDLPVVLSYAGCSLPDYVGAEPWSVSTEEMLSSGSLRFLPDNKYKLEIDSKTRCVTDEGVETEWVADDTDYFTAYYEGDKNDLSFYADLPNPKEILLFSGKIVGDDLFIFDALGDVLMHFEKR